MVMGQRGAWPYHRFYKGSELQGWGCRVPDCHRPGGKAWTRHPAPFGSALSGHAGAASPLGTRSSVLRPPDLFECSRRAGTRLRKTRVCYETPRGSLGIRLNSSVHTGGKTRVHGEQLSSHAAGNRGDSTTGSGWCGHWVLGREGKKGS